MTLDDLYHSFDKRNQVDLGVLDFSPAFDTVPHMRLRSKLSSFDIVGPMQKWIQAFLTGRTMSVVVDGEESEPASVLSGVPQGTVLGSLLFLIYVNDMPNVILSGTYIRLFADDCLIYRDISSLDDQVILQRDRVALQGWAERWGMRFNPSKCNILHIHRGDRHLTYLYDFCGCVLQVVSTAKYLGVTISDNLEWHDQVSKVAKKANTSLYFIYRNLKHCPRKARETAYCTITRSSLEYCICSSIWDPRLQKDKDTLGKVNRRGVRMVFNKTWRDSSVSPTQIMKELKWLRLYHRCICLMYKISHGLVAVPPTQLVKPRRNTRGHKFKYQTIGTNSNQCQNSFYPRSIPQWNKLSSDILAPKLTSRACALRVCSPPAAIAVTQAISQTLICKALRIDSPSHAQMNKQCHKTWSFCLKYYILSKSNKIQRQVGGIFHLWQFLLDKIAHGRWPGIKKWRHINNIT